MMKNIILISALMFFAIFSVKATKIVVPTNYPTIQLAIVNSVNGDTVLVLPGVYFENLHFKGKKIVLTSQFYLTNDTSFICSTIIDGSFPAFADTASCIILNSNEDSTTVIQGFTIRGGKGTKWFDIHGAGTYREGGGILTEFSSPIIQYNIICNNVITNTVGVASTGGGGIRSGDGNPTIRNNIICDNDGRYGGGIVLNYTKATIQNNIIKNNTGGQSFGGGAIWATGTNTLTRIDIINNTIANNHISGSGTYGGKGGAVFVFSIKAVLTNNIIWGNTQSSGTPLITFGGLIQTNYNNVQTVVTGTGNISVNPMFVDTVRFLLTASSPCIDAGDTSTIYKDNNTSPANAIYPSLGTYRNDMGVYGGKYAFIMSGCNTTITNINKQEKESDFIIYPNPANDFLFVQFSDKSKKYILNLYDLCGRILISTDSVEINDKLDLKNLASGLYFVNLSACDGTESYTKKVEVYRRQ